MGVAPYARYAHGISPMRFAGMWPIAEYDAAGPGALHIASMSRGAAVNLWKWLEINGNGCDTTQHGKSAGSALSY